MNQSVEDACRCPVCGGQAHSWMYLPRDWRRPHLNAGYQLYWCEECKYGLVSPRPGAEDVPAFYDLASYYTHGGAHSAWSDGAPVSFWNRLRVHLAWRVDRGVDVDESWMKKHLRQGLRVCDIGCGEGTLLAAFQRAGYRVTGVEPDVKARALARGKGIDVYAGTAEDLPRELCDQRFDVVIMKHVLEHCLDPKFALRNAAHLLADGGLIAVETPNNQAFGRRIAGIDWPWLDVPRHLNFFTRRSLTRICRSVGLEVSAVEFRGYTRQFRVPWLDEEKEIHAALHGTSRPKHVALRSWQLLFLSMFVNKARKYDSVRVVAYKT